MDYTGTKDDDHDGRPDDEDNDFKDDDEETCNPASGGGSGVFGGWSLGGDSGGTSSGTYSGGGGYKVGSGIEYQAGKGFNSFKAAKNYLGDPGEGKEWHHVVEQCQGKSTRSGFSPQQIHNTGNLIAVDKSVHEQISAHYSSKHPSGGTVRDYLTNQSFEEQYRYGMQIYNDILKKLKK